MMLLAATAVQAQITIGGSVYGGGNEGVTEGSTSVTVLAGDINEVFGGARIADVKGSTFVHIDGEHASNYIVINKIYGGNDIAGEIGKSATLPAALTRTGENKISDNWNAFVRISTKTTTTGEGADAKVEETADAQKIYIGQLFGGGNGDYDYTSDDSPYKGKNKPELGKTYLELLGGSIVYAYGGGNCATVTDSTVIFMDNPSKVVNSIFDKDGNELLTTDRFRNKMGINTGFSKPHSDEFQIGRFFGGNNVAEMDIRPTWRLKRGLIRNLYNGGNKGTMTHENGILMLLNSPDLTVDNVYGGCRMADVMPMKDGKINKIDKETVDGIEYPAGYAARLRIDAGNINNVYGGNDIKGKVYGGNSVGIHTSIHGDVYGGGNGSYPYTDNEKLKDDDIYGDLYYEVPAGKTSAEALKDFRPNAESVSIRVLGTDADHPTVIGGALYCGGNSATLHNDDPYANAAAELKIGSYVIADKVFLGNNGENMVTTNEEVKDDKGNIITREGTLLTLKSKDKTSDGSKFSSMDLTDPAQFEKYMDAVAMDIKPRVVFDPATSDNPGYIPYSTKFGSLYCGGNVGSMKTNGAETINFNDKVIIFEKLVGGSNDANIPARDGLNAEYLGGLLGDPDPVPAGSSEGTIGNKLILNFGGLKMQPMRWKVQRDADYAIVKDEDGNVTYERDANGNRILEWNTISASTGKEVAPITEGSSIESTADDIDRRLKGGNIYGGCYNSGHVNGNVVINLNASTVDRKGEFGIFDEIEENEGEAILYANDSYKIKKRRSGVILDKQGMDVLGKALNVFGGGYGDESEIWGSTTINLNTGYTFQIFGGGQKGAIGKGVRSTETKKLEYSTYDPRYSCTVNLKGNYEGVYRGHANDTDDMAEAEFIYGGAFEAPIAGNTIINLGNGRIFNSFAGSCNADILGHTETYIGRSGVDDNNKDVLGFPWVRDHVYGGNDLGGEIKNKNNFLGRVSEDLRSKLHNPDNKETPDVTNASAYMEYIQGRVDYIFGGCYGDYDYKDRYFAKYTNDDGSDKPGFTKPRLDNAFVNFRSNLHTRNAAERIFGAGQGSKRGIGVDSMQNRSYVLVDIPQTLAKFQAMEVFGAGANCGLGMAITPSTVEGQPVLASAVIDLMRGQIGATYGGSYNEGTTRRTVTNVPLGSTIKLDRIFGGAYGDDPNYPCDVYEAKVNYNSEDARVSTIFGGNNHADRTLYGQVNINVPAWSDKESGYLATVYGAGFGKDTWSQYTEVNLLEGARVYEVYGGGNNGKVLNTESLAKWRHDEGAVLDLSLPGYEDTAKPYTDKDGKTFYLDAGLESPLVRVARLDGRKYNTNVHIHKGATVVNYAYGGGYGEDAVVSGTTYIDLLGGTVTKDLYAGGTSGAVQDYYKAKTFTASTTAYIEGGMARNVYGGGWKGSVGYHDGGLSASTDGDILGETNVVIGIRKDRTEALPGDYGFYDGIPAIQRNAYGGGEGGAVYGVAHVTMNNGYIGYIYNTETQAYEEKVNDETWTDHVGADRLSDCGNLFGGGYDDNSSVDESHITMLGGTVRNSIFGGGEIATIGRGATQESGVDNKVRELKAIYKPGGTHIEMYNGHVRRNIFGGGKGYNILGYGGVHGYYTDGYVFGKTEVFIHGGEVGTDEGLADGYGNVFGGGDVGFVYSGSYLTGTHDEGTGSPNHYYYKDAAGNLTEDCKVVIAPMLQVRKEGTPVTYGGNTYNAYDYVPTDYLNTLPADKTNTSWKNLYTGDRKPDGTVDSDDPEERGIHIHNAVFAGGNVSSNSESYSNATTVFGNTTATLYDVYHHDFITVGTEHTGGLYGGGNLSIVGGYRELNITNYGTDYYGLDQQISLEEYQKLTNRERAYFKLEYLCQQDITINGKSYKQNDRISEDEYNALPADYRTTTYWVQYGFCSIYAGRLLNTIQRADFCGVYGSRLVLQGAKDRVADVADATEYTINRIGELSLNQQRSVAGDTEESKKLHGNYFGIYSVVNYLGSLTSDVHFDDPRRYVEKGQTYESATADTYYKWKVDHLTKRDRNNGTSYNQVALASGVFLELTSETSTAKNKIYGDITGVVELDLINVKKDIEGGGYVYARNEHGARTEHLEYQNVLLSEYNMKKTVGDVEWRNEARTHKRYTYSATDLKDMQTSGNFIHKSKRIVDDCYPNNGIYNDGYKKSPAHYWFIKGEVYIYDQVVSAYAGSASAYSKEVKIPLTITAGSNGRLKLLNVQPSLYAYYADETRSESKKVNEDGVKVDNESMTYHLNDVITWWDWHQLSQNEQKFFVKETYVNTDTCYVGGTKYAPGTYVLENDPSVHDGVINNTAYQQFLKSHPTVLDYSQNEVTDLSKLFHPSNNIGHNTGYALTLDMNSPKDWDDWYSPVNRTNGEKIRKEIYDNLEAAAKEQYREGPTYTLTGASGLYGQREYGVGEIITKEVYDDYNSTVGKMAQQPEGQATVEPAYVALADFGNTQAGNAISESDYNALTDKSNFDPAMICVNTIQLGDETYVLLGELVSGTDAKLNALAQKYMDYNNSKINADKIDLAGALDYVLSNLSKAYYIKTEGLYGGQYFESGVNYGAIKSWCQLTDARNNFDYNYDALDLLVDPEYHGEGYIDTYYKSPYSDIKAVAYDAVNTTPGTLTYFDNDNTKHTIASGASISSEDYEKVRNDQLHYTRVQVEQGADTQTVYIVNETLVDNGTPYAKGQDISEKDYKSLSDVNKEKVDVVTFQKGTTAEVKYYCFENYTPAETFNTESGAAGEKGSVISAAVFNNDIPNYQKNFTIQGSEPTETTTLYVSRESNAKDVTSEKVISAVYQYTYYEADDEGEGVSLVNELHVLNIRLQMESGAPEIGPLNAPPAVLPGNSLGLKAPTVNPGLYEVLTSGWELFNSEEDAMLHRNGIPFTNNGTPLYWYQNQKVFLAFYSKTYLGKTYSNYVPVTVANYHDLDAIMKDTEHHLYVDHPDVMRNSKIYIDNRDCESDPTKSELDLLRDFFDLSVLSGSAAEGSAIAGHAALDPHVKGGADLEFILNSNVSPKAYSVSGGSPTGWTPIGDATNCFEGNFHGDGYTISGLNNSLFGNLCGSVFNLGVTGSFTSAGVADTGDGYVENCWINTSATSGFPAGTRAVFGNPSRSSGTQLVNSYYPETKAYSTSNNGRGIARAMSEADFYDGTVAYNLNGFHLNKRYYDHALNGSPVEYNYLKEESDGKLSENMLTGYYPAEPDAQYGYLGYVEDRYKDGDFVYAGGTVPDAYDDRMRVTHDGSQAIINYAPIWPDDYIYFGQTLTYDYNATRPHDLLPSHIVKSSGRLPVNNTSNRVYRAPAYYRSNAKDVAHFNLWAYLAAYSKPKSITDTDVKEAYPNMTAIDFAGHNDNKWSLGTVSDGSAIGTPAFYPPLLDCSDGLLGISNEGETSNLLVYAPSPEVNNQTYTTLANYFIDPDYTDYYKDDDYRGVAIAPLASVHGHLVESDLMAKNDHLLTDKQDFNAPIAYTFDDNHRMWYQRTPDSYVDTQTGWESVSLPFTAELVTTHQKGEITHFYSGSKSIDTDSETKIGHEYWLREMKGLTTKGDEAVAFFNYPDATGTETKTATNTFLWDYYYQDKAITGDRNDANSDKYQQFYSTARAYTAYPNVQKATPYLVGFPGFTYYEFDLSGSFMAQNTASPAPDRLDRQVITFASRTGETVAVSDTELEEGAVGPENGYYFKPNYLNIEVPAGGYIMAAEGDKYLKVDETTTDKRLSAFRSYFQANKPVTRSIRFSNIGSQMGDDDCRAAESIEFSAKNHTIVVTSHMRTMADVGIYSVSGVCLATFNISPEETVETPIHTSGVYIVRAARGHYTKKITLK